VNEGRNRRLSDPSSILGWSTKIKNLGRLNGGKEGGVMSDKSKQTESYNLLLSLIKAASDWREIEPMQPENASNEESFFWEQLTRIEWELGMGVTKEAIDLFKLEGESVPYQFVTKYIRKATCGGADKKDAAK
jgi:hypothetical protein